MIKIKSGISQAFWCDASNGVARFEPAEIAFDTDEREPISWFDNLFEGGILLPEETDETLRPLTMLVSGPPGSGKTTLVTELCYRLAVNNQKNKRPLSTLYISTDADTDRMINNAVDLGWDRAKDYFQSFDLKDKDPKVKSYLKSIINVWGREKFMPLLERQDILSAIVESALTSLDQWVLKSKTDFMQRMRKVIMASPINKATGGDDGEDNKRYIPDILVIDSLNILNPEKQTDYFQAFVKACKATKLVIFMLDSGGDENQEHEFWEYFSDIVLRLDYQYVHDYYVRTIEVVKARYQVHRWGKHQLKIYANPKPYPVPSRQDIEGVQKYNTMMRRAHPYRTSGGVFIFPSIHSYLSVYKRKTSSEGTDFDEIYPKKLNDILKIPKERCTAFIGERGGHKSHLGYLHLLHRLLSTDQDCDPCEGCLVVSLREDEISLRNKLSRLMQEEFGYPPAKLNQLERDNHVEFLYFPPGYITPEEFFHRIFISIHRLKKQNGPLTVMFNSIDQIAARFPLCAKQEIFIPGIIQSLCGEGITSLWVAVDEPGQPAQQYGLLPMADLIVSFSLHKYFATEYYEHVEKAWADDFKKDPALQIKFNSLQTNAISNPDLTREAVELQVIRFSGEERAGKRGILELINKDKLDKFPYSKEGLQFTPLSNEVAQRRPLSDEIRYFSV